MFKSLTFKRLTFLIFIGATLLILRPSFGQIEMNSAGNVGIGSYSPSSNYNLRAGAVSFSSAVSSSTSSYQIYSSYSKTSRNAGIGTSWSSSNTLTVSGIGSELTSSVDHIVYIGGGSYSGNSGYELYVNGSALAFGGIWQPSDKKLKKNIKPLDKDKLKEKLMKVKSANYEYKTREELIALHNSGQAQFHVDTLYRMDSVLLDDGSFDLALTNEIKEVVVDVPHYQEGMKYGLIAQEVKEIFPELVREDERTGLYAIDYNGFIPILLDMVQAQQSQIEDMESRLAKIEAKEKDKSSSNSRTSEEDDASTDNPTEGVNLLQNAPNPFSDRTEIAFTVNIDAQEATLFIYDLQGTQVKSYPINQRGSGSITIQGNELKAGMYLYSLLVDGEIVGTEKMVLTK